MRTRSVRDETLLHELTQHQARVGQRRVFLSATDAAQYEAGFSRYPQPMPEKVRMSTPYSTGWHDAAHAAKKERFQ